MAQASPLTTLEATVTRTLEGNWEVICVEVTRWPASAAAGDDGRPRGARVVLTETYGSKEAAMVAAERLAAAMGYPVGALRWS